MSEEPGRAAQTTLHTARITLVPLAGEHFEGEVELDTDGEVMRYLTGRPRTRAQVEVMHRKRLAIGRDSAGLGFWAGLVEGEFVGWWILEPSERAEQRRIGGQAELGYRLLRRHWRRGLASEGARTHPARLRRSRSRPDPRRDDGGEPGVAGHDGVGRAAVCPHLPPCLR